jgi:4-hydroxy-2-oxoheptanedioate aldolase
MRDLRNLLHADRPAIGLWAQIPTALTAELAAAAGPDYVVVDQQHGALAPRELMAMLTAIETAGAPPLVRVARNDVTVIGQVLDFGAAGVIVPMVESQDEAAAAIAACRYAPGGVRSFGVLRGSQPEPVCLTMIETRGGLENVDEIARTPGLDGIYIGPADLALSLGLQPAFRHEDPQLLQAIQRIREACAAAGVICGLHCLAGEDAARFTGEGFALVTAGHDLFFLRDALAAELRAARA